MPGLEQEPTGSGARPPGSGRYDEGATAMRKPDFDNVLAVLARDRPSRPTLFEFFLNTPLDERLTGERLPPGADAVAWNRLNLHAYHRTGYDYVTIRTGLEFPKGAVHREKTKSLNEGAVIHDRASFEAYPWPDPAACDYSTIDILRHELPSGMKFIGFGPGGVLENLIEYVGFDALCFMLSDDPDLVQDVVDAIGSRLVEHYAILGRFAEVGAMISNDDWGFKTQTMLSPDDMRKYIIPWHRKIAQTIHSSGRPAILHSCGNLAEVMDDIIDDIGYEAKHSYEDSIMPVEEAYEKWGRRLAILGGIDVDFICRNTPEAIRERSRKMLERASERGGYALGSGNSIPEYVPADAYLAMISAAVG